MACWSSARSATGLQLAQEIHVSGRPVTLAVGGHVRMPRVYRGRDIQWWMLRGGLLDQRIEEVDDPDRARRVPSPQLVGTPERATLDLNVLRGLGVEIVGRLAGIRDGKAQFSGSLRNVCALADLKMNRLLDAIDEWVGAQRAARRGRRRRTLCADARSARHRGSASPGRGRSHRGLGDRLLARIILGSTCRCSTARAR